MVYLAVFAMCGWLVVLLQSFVNHSISRRLTHVLALHDATKDEHLPVLLAQYQEKLRNRLNRRLTATDDDEEDGQDEGSTLIIETTVGKLHHRRCIPMPGAADEPDSDHVMVFRKSNKNSNDILSIRSSEALMFFAQFFQLIIDFHFGFYVVHMQQRVPYAFEVYATVFSPTVLSLVRAVYRADKCVACKHLVRAFVLIVRGLLLTRERLGGHMLSRFVVHVVTVLPFLVMMYLLMMMTRKLSLLVAVLHLNDEAVSDVLEHMEVVKTIRRRIQITLRHTKIVRGAANPQKAEEMLERAKKGELAVLSDLSQRDDLRTGRITRKEIAELLFSGDAADNLSVTPADVAEFMDRKAYAAYVLESKADQATAQTARTLASAADEQDDSIALSELSSYLVRYIAEVLHDAQELSPKARVVNRFKKLVTALDSVDDAALQYAQDLALCKHVFRATDADNSGLISSHELRSSLRRYKISVSQAEFKQIFRVIDPDQSKTMSMDEWIDFMMATEENLELQTQEATEMLQKTNAAKGDSLEVYVSEGAGVFLGARAGHFIGGVVGGMVSRGQQIKRSLHAASDLCSFVLSMQLCCCVCRLRR